jgi:hypothetical protein
MQPQRLSIGLSKTLLQFLSRALQRDRLGLGTECAQFVSS